VRHGITHEVDCEHCRRYRNAAGALSSSAWEASKIALMRGISAGSDLSWQDEEEVFCEKASPDNMKTQSLVVQERAQFGPSHRRADERRFEDLTIRDGIAETSVH
jgi:hypothetical protein